MAGLLFGVAARVRRVNEASARAAPAVSRNFEFTAADGGVLSVRLEPLGLPGQQYLWGPIYALKVGWFYLVRLVRRDKRRQVRLVEGEYPTDRELTRRTATDLPDAIEVGLDVWRAALQES
jgi:hypothetical protein